jgi:oligopeptide transport system substrate-binding protein
MMHRLPMLTRIWRTAFFAAWVCLPLIPLPGQAAAPVVLHRGNQAEPDSLDPHKVGGAWENNIIGDMFLGLTTESAQGKPIPGSAENWTISPDGMTWTFTLRPGLVWSDGVALKASDFVFGFRRVLDPKTAAQYASIQYPIKNAEAVNGGKLPVDQLGVRAVDDRTLEITLEAPTPFLAGLLAHYTAFPIPEHIYKKFGDEWVRAGTMVSNGAYMLVHWKPHDQIKVVKNPLFYDARNVAIDEVYYYPTDDTAAALTRFRAGELDVNIGTRGFPISQLDWLKQNMPGQARLFPMLGNEYIVLNMRRAPFNDARLRRAISLCLDRPLLTEKVNRDGSVPAYSFIPPGIANYHGGAKLEFADWPMEKRRDEAKRLLKEAGYGADRPFTFDYMYMISIDSRRAVVAQAAMLKQCGMIVRLIGNEPKVHYTSLREADFIAAQARWGADYNDPQTFLYLLDSRSGAYNYGGYSSPTFDRLLDEGKVTLDLEKRAEILAQAEQTALSDSGVVPLSFFTSKSLVAPYVKGYEDNVQNIYRTRWMRLER